jgi:hypothetical protein
MIAQAQSSDFEPIPGVGYYVILHPNALRGLAGESAPSGFIDVMAQAGAGTLTKGAVAQYRGCTFLVSSKYTATADVYPVYLVPKDSIAAGDLGSIEFIHWSAPGVGNELGQLMGVGYKGILGAKVLDFSESTSGAGVNATSVPRVLRFGVASGVFGF